MRSGTDLADIFYCRNFQHEFRIDRYSEISPADERALSGDALTRSIHQARARLHEAGVTIGDVVLFQGAQSTEAFVLFWATVLTGAIFAAVDHEWPEYLLARATEKLRPKLVVTTSARLQICRSCFAGAQRVVIHRDMIALDLRSGESLWPDWLSIAPTPTEPASISSSAPAVYLFTSGSTGIPKAVILSRTALAHGAQVTLSSFGWKVGERLLNLPEPHTMSGLRNAMVAAPLGGLAWSPVAPALRANIFSLIDHVIQSQCAHLVIGPALVRQLVLTGDRLPPNTFDALKAIYSTGATLNAQSALAFFKQYHIPIINYYGLTETGGICLSQSRQNWEPTDISLGIPVGCSARLAPTEHIADENIGELQILSAQLMSGYLDDPDRTEARFDGDWLRTGDVMRRDSDGKYYLLGRADLFIKTAATERVHPEEIELVLERHPAIADVAITGRKTDLDIEQIVALVVLHRPQESNPQLASELARFVTTHLGAGRAPNDIRFITKLPRQDNGKLVRKALGDLVK